jgi:hypothetical protein
MEENEAEAMPANGYQSVGLRRTAYQRFIQYMGRLQDNKARRVSASDALENLLDIADNQTSLSLKETPPSE